MKEVMLGAIPLFAGVVLVTFGMFDDWAVTIVGWALIAYGVAVHTKTVVIMRKREERKFSDYIKYGPHSFAKNW